MRTLSTRVVATIGVVSLLGALYFFLDTVNFLRSATPTYGQVIRLAERESASARWPASTRAPVITFATPAGQIITFIAIVSSNPSSYQVGDRVPVLFDPQRPSRARLRTLTDLWFRSVLLFIFGALFIATYYVQRTARPQALRG
jgi:hypothetical protein